MSDLWRQRLFSWPANIEQPLVVPALIAIGVGLTIAGVCIALATRSRAKDDKFRRELWQRYITWLVLIPVLVVPILLGPVWAILTITVIALLSYREFARATGFFRETVLSAFVVLGVLAMMFAALDHWYNLFAALPSLITAIIAFVAILQDQPKGYVQRFGLAMMAVLLFGVCMGYLAYFSNDKLGASLLLILLLGVELNDVFAFTCGKLFGKRKLSPNTSPNKTVAGSVGALILTTTLTYILIGIAMPDSVIASPVHRIMLGMIISIAGQAGDLMISSIKRDVGVKDMGNWLPGHGGVLDRFDSILLAAPAMFHYVAYFEGMGRGLDVRFISGGGL